MAERQVLLEHYEEQRKLLKFKDDVIWKLSQELKKKYDFYQEEFDKETRHEMNEWARLVDRYAAELKKYEGNYVNDGSLSLADTGKIAANQRADDFLQKHPTLSPLVKKLYDQCQQGSTQADLTANLKIQDSANSGACPKDEFINAVFDSVKGLKPAELMQLLVAFSNEYEQQVNYEDFIRLIERQGELPQGIEQRNLQMEMMKATPGGRPSERGMRETVDRVKLSA